MNNLLKAAAAASIAMSGLALAAPAAAQVNGIATVDVALAVAGAQARNTAYQQIATQYQAQRTTIQQRRQQRQDLVKTFDTNGDGQLDQAEQAVTQDANNATVRQIQAIDQEIAQLENPIQRAQVYVVSQIAQQVSPSLEKVIADNKINFVVSPDSLIFSADGANVTGKLVTALNTAVPAVTAFPPEGWQPSEAGVNLYQQVQQILLINAMQQQQAAQQQAGQQSGEVPSR